MYLRETRRTNRDGSVVSYLQLAHNERSAQTGNPVAKVIHNFGRAEHVDRCPGPPGVVDLTVPYAGAGCGRGARRGGRDLGLPPAGWRVDAGPVVGPAWDRRGDPSGRDQSPPGRGGGRTDRVRAGRAAGPEARLEVGCDQVGREAGRDQRPHGVHRRPGVSGDGFLLEALPEIASEIFGSVAHLLNLDLDIIFVDTTSTYWEVDGADELADLQDNVDDDGVSRPVENGARAFGHSKDHRTDLPQVVIAMAVTRDGVPVRCWTFPGNTADTSIIRTVKDDLAGWNCRRMVWVADRGFASAANRAYLTRGGGHYIHAEKLRNTNSEAAAALARPARYRTVAGTLRVKEVAVAPGGNGDGDDGARAQRFVVCHNPEQADRDRPSAAASSHTSSS